MEKRVLAIFDREENYAYRLMEFITGRTGFPFEIHIFTDGSKFCSYAKIKEIEFLLISESVYDQSVEDLKIPHIIILSESGNNLNKALHHINKYQSCETIFREIMEYYTDKSENASVILRTGMRKMKIIGIYTPVGRCLQTTFSITLGQMLARQFKTLYLNFEIYSGFSGLLNKNFHSDISDLMYYFNCTRDKLAYRLESMIETVGGLDFIPPAEIHHNLIGIRGEQWLDLFSEIEKCSEYEYLLLDLTEGLVDLWDVLRNCDYVYTITRGDGLAMAKTEQYEKALKSMQYEDIITKTKKWNLPLFKQLPVRFEEFTYGDLAGYIKENVFPDLFKEDGNE